MHWHYFSLSRKTICDFITCKPLINCKSLLPPYVIPFLSKNPDNLPLSSNFFSCWPQLLFVFFPLSFILSHFLSSFFRSWIAWFKCFNLFAPLSKHCQKEESVLNQVKTEWKKEIELQCCAVLLIVWPIWSKKRHSHPTNELNFTNDTQLLYALVLVVSPCFLFALSTISIVFI